MDIFIGVIVGLLVLMALITLHELGHFIAARRNGVKVLEFGICFPPRAIAWVKDPKTKKWTRLKKSEWGKPQKGLIFSLNWLPIGGFCQMDGESANDTRKGTFGNARFWAKTKILFAGVAMNWLTAFIILLVLSLTGLPKMIPNQFSIPSDETVSNRSHVTVTEVLDDSPAKAAGFEKDDTIIAVSGEEVFAPSDVSKINSKHVGEEVIYTITRKSNCESKTPEVTPNEGEANCEDPEDKELLLTAKLNNADAEYLLGITMSSSQELYHYTWSAPVVAAGLTVQLTGETLKGVGELIGNLVSGAFKQLNLDDNTRAEGRAALESAGESVSGPVGIIGVIFPAFTSAGATNVAYLAALISVSLACMNILPIPALDGGRWLLIAIFKLRKKELSKELEEKIVSRAFLVLLILIALITILDITRFF